MNKRRKKKKSLVWGIYMILNIINNKMYIGSSKNVKRRLQEHKRELRKGIHINKHLQNAWNKYGEENFLFKEIESIDTTLNNNFLLKDLRELETKYIKLFCTSDTEFGYNIIPGGVGGDDNIVIPDEVREKISKSNKGKLAWNKGIPMSELQREKLKKYKEDLYGKKIDIYTTDFKFIETLPSIRETSRKYKCGRNTIIDSCNGKSSPIRHIFLYNRDSIEEAKIRINKLKESNKEYTTLRRCSVKDDKGKRKIDVYDMFGNFLETLESVKEASNKYKVSARQISKISSGKMISYSNYIFRYSGDNSNLNYDYNKGKKLYNNSKYVIYNLNREKIFETRYKSEIIEFINKKYKRMKGTILRKLQSCNHKNNEFNIKDFIIKLEKIILIAPNSSDTINGTAPT